jgi:outer membrane protein TolC
MIQLAIIILGFGVAHAGELFAPVLVSPAAQGQPIVQEQQDLQQFVQILSRAPTLRAMRLRYAASQRAEAGAGRLPDPMIGLGYARLRMPMENRPIYEAMIEQPLPRWGERDAARAMAVADSAMASAALHIDIGMLAGQIAMLLAELDGLQARMDEGQFEFKRIRALSDTISARVGQGSATVLDRLAVDTRLESLQVRIADWERQMADKSAEIRAWLAIPATQDLPTFTAPVPATLNVEQTPKIRQALAERDMALAALQAVQSMRRPMMAVGVRGMLEETDDGNERTIGATLSISLPVAHEAIRADIDAALTRVHAAEQLIEAARLQSQAAVNVAKRAVEQAQRITTLATTLIARADAEQQALITAAAGAGVSIAAILDVSDRLAELRIDLIDATVSANLARAELWPHVVMDMPVVTGTKP